MKKRLFAVFLAVVLFATAIIVMPNNNVAQGDGTNTTWDNSVHALEDGQYPSKEMYTLTQGEDEYALKNKWHVTTFNDCELDRDPEHDNQELYKETGTGGDLITASRGDTPSQFKNDIPGYDGGSYSYYAALYDDYENAQDPKNIRLAVYNYSGFDITDYQYLRFQMMRQNIELDPNHWGKGDDPYAFVMIYGANGEKYERRFTDIFNNSANRIYNYLFDVSDLNFVVTCVEFHFKTIRRESTGLADPARVWVDNIRFVKNATHSKYYVSNVYENKKVFSYCEAKKGSVVKAVPYGSYTTANDIAFTTDANTGIDGSEGSVRIFPAGKQAWYQYSFRRDNLSENFYLNDYQYLRFYITVGEKIPINRTKNTVQFENGINWPDDYDSQKVDGDRVFPVTVWFSHYDDYAANINDGNGYGVAQGSIKLNLIEDGGNGRGWFVCVVPLSRINSQNGSNFDKRKPIKSISVQMGLLNITGVTSAYAIHIDQFEFLGYSYSENTEYKYKAGHYQVLENFENKADAYLNVEDFSKNSTALAMRKYDVTVNPNIETNYGAWMHKYDNNGNSPQYGSYYTADYNSTVTQGMYADWIRASEGTYNGKFSGNLEAAYNLDERPMDMSKFTHFSLDFTIRPQHRCYDHATAPGLQGTNETFRIRLRGGNSESTYFESHLSFTLNLSADMTGTGSNPFYESSDGIQIYPLEGFIPGREGAYTCSGSMRITFTLADILANVQNVNFDITKIDQFRFEWLKAGKTNRDDQEYDQRRCDMFLDNLVGFTPDMTLTVRTQGVPESDAMQPFVYRIVGGDDVSEHVNCSFTLQGNDTEVIYNLPFNSYTIEQTDWAWRFYVKDDPNLKQQIAQKMATLDKPTAGSFTYKDMVENQVPLHYEIVFTPTKSHSKWLGDEKRAHFKARN